ncbi:MAG: hypothetical protein JRH20_04650 [Deltaproteobacteria bacterium]|nr:hypothetical protein [Deltaproteobacteria bacterium]
MKVKIIAVASVLIVALAIPTAAVAGKPSSARGAPAPIKKFLAKMFPGRSPVVTKITPPELAKRFKISLYQIDSIVVLIKDRGLYPLYQLRGRRRTSRPLKFDYLVEDLDGNKSPELYFMWHRRRGEMKMGGCYSFKGAFRCVHIKGPGSGMRFYRDDASQMVTVVTTLFPMPRGKIAQIAALQLRPARTGKTYLLKWKSRVDLRGFQRAPTQVLDTRPIEPFR